MSFRALKLIVHAFKISLGIRHFALYELRHEIIVDSALGLVFAYLTSFP